MDKLMDEDGRIILLNIQIENTVFSMVSIYAPNCRTLGCINVPFLHLIFLSIGIRVSLKSLPTIGIPVPCSFKNLLTFKKKHISQCSAVRCIYTYH
jgi:hypothetical protein